jgi:hypothetical protein
MVRVVWVWKGTVGKSYILLLGYSLLVNEHAMSSKQKV